MHFDVLTASVIKNPHKSIKDKRRSESLSYLERSFANKRMAEISQWERLGVVQEALDGKSRSKRVYTSSLTTHFLTGLSSGYRQQDRLFELDQILLRLWGGGAKQHTDQFDNWLPGAIGLPSGHLLLDEGANPHVHIQTQQSGRTAFDELLSAFQAHKHASVSVPWGAQIDCAQGFEDVLQKRVERCLDMPIPTDMLNRYMSSLLSFALSASTESEVKIWEGWRDRLFEKDPIFGFGHGDAFQALVRPPGYRAHPHFSEIGKLIGQFRLEHGEGPSPDQVKAMGLKLFEVKETRYQDVAHNWVRKMVEATHRNGRKLAPCPDYFWECVLDHPKSIEVGRFLLKSGASAPWQTPGNGQRSNMVLSEWSGRRQDRLSTLIKLTQETTIDLSWAMENIDQYLIKHPGKTPFCVSEIKHCVELLEKSGAALPAPFLEFATTLLQNQCFKKAAHYVQKDIIQFIHEQGWFKTILSSPFPADYSASVAQKFTTNWMQNPDDFSLMEAFDPLNYSQPMRMNAAVYAIRENQDDMGGWIKKAVEFNPENANTLFQLAFDRRNRSEILYKTSKSLFSAMGHLKELGWSIPSEITNAKLIGPTVNGVSYAWSPEQQKNVVSLMKISGVDFNYENGALLTGLLNKEDEVPKSEASRFEALMPFVQALLDNGANPCLLPPITDSVRPLSVFLSVEQQSRYMQDNTPSIPRSLRPRRI